MSKCCRFGEGATETGAAEIVLDSDRTCLWSSCGAWKKWLSRIPRKAFNLQRQAWIQISAQQEIFEGFCEHLWCFPKPFASLITLNSFLSKKRVKMLRSAAWYLIDSFSCPTMNVIISGLLETFGAADHSKLAWSVFHHAAICKAPSLSSTAEPLMVGCFEI